MDIINIFISIAILIIIYIGIFQETDLYSTQLMNLFYITFILIIIIVTGIFKNIDSFLKIKPYDAENIEKNTELSRQDTLIGLLKKIN
jgi:hypothetical protein